MTFHGRMRALLLLAGLSLCFVMSACADNDSAVPIEAPIEASFSLPSPSPAHRDTGYQDVKVYFDGLLTDRGYVLDGTVYLAPDAICAYYGLELSLDSDITGFHLSVPGLKMTGGAEDEYMQANFRYLYSPNGYLDTGGRVYLPSDVIERAFGVNVVLSGEPVRAELSTTGYSLIQGGEDYYDLHYPIEDMYWLSHIIYAEAREQPLAGQIGVGNVVFNRIASDDFPDTVFDVIFDRTHVVQFDPTATGGVLEDPDELSTIAACLCFEGYSTVGNSLYFVNPVTGDSSWFEAKLTYVTTIGGHDFYA